LRHCSNPINFHSITEKNIVVIFIVIRSFINPWRFAVIMQCWPLLRDVVTTLQIISSLFMPKTINSYKRSESNPS
jgi:hypothetical protein